MVPVNLGGSEAGGSSLFDKWNMALGARGT